MNGGPLADAVPFVVGRCAGRYAEHSVHVDAGQASVGWLIVWQRSLCAEKIVQKTEIIVEKLSHDFQY